MLISCRTEDLAVMQDELNTLIEAYWFASPENVGHLPLDFNWPTYQHLAQLGMLHVFGARNGRDRLVGAAIYTVVEAPHHKGHVVADCDTLCTDLALRGLGIGRKLMMFVEATLRSIGVHEMLNRARHVYDADHLFPSLGFKAIETVYSKRLV